MNSRNIVTILFFVVAAMASGLQAQTVQKWVDEDGVTHFSDQKPASNKSEVREIEIPSDALSGYDSKEVNQRLNTVIQQMEQDRMAREREFAAQKRAREAEKKAERQRQLEEDELKPKEGIPAASKQYRRLMERKLEKQKQQTGTADETVE